MRNHDYLRVLTAQDDIDTDGVFVHVIHSLLGVKPVLTLDRDRDQSPDNPHRVQLSVRCSDGRILHLNLEVPRELLQGNLSITSHYDIGPRFVDGFTRRLAFLLPDSLHGKSTKLDGLRRASSGRSNSLVRGWCMPEVCEDGDAWER